MKPCKHLDHDPSHYPSCELIESECRDDNGHPVRFFRRPEYVPGKRDVQFCGQGRGRINEIFGCYGEMHCYQESK